MKRMKTRQTGCPGCFPCTNCQVYMHFPWCFPIVAGEVIKIDIILIVTEFTVKTVVSYIQNNSILLQMQID